MKIQGLPGTKGQIDIKEMMQYVNSCLKDHGKLDELKEVEVERLRVRFAGEFLRDRGYMIPKQEKSETGDSTDSSAETGETGGGVGQ